MVSCLRTKLKSQRGASLSVALLLFLVCAALSAVILAAATATTGQFADRSKADQRYYAVSSASELFLGSLDGSAPEGVASGGDNTLTFQVVQQKTSNYKTTGGTTTLVPNSTTATSVDFKAPANSTKWFNFLPSATLYAFSGDAGKTEAQSEAALANALKSGAWIEPFTQGRWALNPAPAGLEDFNYTVNPQFAGGSSLPSATALAVDAHGTLEKNSWTFPLTFSNGAAPRTYTMYVVLSADVTTPVSTSTVINSVVENGSVIETIQETQTTNITWSVDKVATGWSDSNA